MLRWLREWWQLFKEEWRAYKHDRKRRVGKRVVPAPLDRMVEGKPPCEPSDSRLKTMLYELDLDPKDFTQEAVDARKESENSAENSSGGSAENSA